MTRWTRGSSFSRAALVLVIVTAASGLAIIYLQALSTQFGARSVTLSDDTVSMAATYRLSFVTQAAGTMGSIDIQFCSNDPFPGAPCDAPVGLDASHATIGAQVGAIGFFVTRSSAANEIILTRPPQNAAAALNSYDLQNIVNPSATGSYYIRVQTYASTDISGSATGYGGLAFAIAAPLSVRAEVPPYLLFCAAVTIAGDDCNTTSGNYVDFGELGSTVTRQTTTQLLAATNAGSGYNIQVDGTTLTSGNDVIPALSSDVSRRGVSQFGLNLQANTTPAVGAAVSGSGSVMPAYDQANFFRFNSGDQLAGTPGPATPGKYTVSYIVNVAPGQPPGVYVSTLTYIAVGNF